MKEKRKVLTLWNNVFGEKSRVETIKDNIDEVLSKSTQDNEQVELQSEIDEWLSLPDNEQDEWAGLLTTQEAASYLEISENALNLRRYQGRLPEFIKKGNWIAYKKSDLDEWLLEHRNPEYLTIPQAMKILKVNRAYLDARRYDKVPSDKGPAWVKLKSSGIRYLKYDVEAYKKKMSTPKKIVPKMSIPKKIKPGVIKWSRQADHDDHKALAEYVRMCGLTQSELSKLTTTFTTPNAFDSPSAPVSPMGKAVPNQWHDPYTEISKKLDQILVKLDALSEKGKKNAK